MVAQLVLDVLADNTHRRVTVEAEPPKAKRKTAAAKAATAEKNTKRKTAKKPAGTAPQVGQPCPLCGKGTIVRGRTAYGCSEWRNGCTWRAPLDPQAGD